MREGQLEFTAAELLTDHAYEEPLIATGVRCHGGFIEGHYISPRTQIRVPAIEAWKRRLRSENRPLICIPDRYVPPHYPSYEQARLLLREGIVAPISRSLTIISILEGFGARIRQVPVPDLGREVVEDVRGTALGHLAGGLFEAHARDEAGHRDQGGHKQMWEAARDLGLAKPEIPGDVLLELMMGAGSRRERRRLFPELSLRMESLLTIMANVLVVEVFAGQVFSWAQQLLGDPEVSANPLAARRMVAHIEADEHPHVEYLRTALSELRARTLRSEDGKRELSGCEVVDAIFAEQLRGIGSTRPAEQREQVREKIHRELLERPQSTELRRRFESLDAGWVFPRAEDEPLGLLLESH